MLIVISPAKSLDFMSPLKQKETSQPLFLQDAAELMSIAKKMTVANIAELMDLSPTLAELNAERFLNWAEQPDPKNLRQAVFAFDGDVYEGLAARSLNAGQLSYLQSHLRILSGLYGVLRPFDQIQAYRLEMGRQFSNLRGKNLYAFWGNQVSEVLAGALQQQKNKTLVNLASEEYFKVVNTKFMPGKVITPVFQDYKNGQYKIISFYAKRARGLMARYCAVHRINNPENLKNFDLDGYRFHAEISDDAHWVFRRQQ